ncbi:hypothetical protein AB8O64_05270 [Streptomyces sp. QH1-20]|uniref:hypothetical protein n=1 Tax=Streptomyces sp. QH1-20 TaxID=3240934 RepID=UPI00351896B3
MIAMKRRAIRAAAARPCPDRRFRLRPVDEVRREATVSGDKTGTIGVTVVRVEKDRNADLSGLEDPSKYSDETPYYLHYKLTKTAEGKSDDESAHFEAPQGGNRLTHLMVFTSFDSTGDPANPLVTRSFDRCKGADHTEWKEVAEGKYVEGCAIFLAAEGTGAPSTLKWTRRSRLS